MSFLRSASKFLALGSVPSFLPRKRKRKTDDDDDDDEVVDMAKDLHLDGTEPAKKRGTILITFRNVEPYTLWLVGYTTSSLSLELTHVAGTSLDLPKIHHPLHLPLRLQIRDTNSYDHLYFTDMYGKDTNIV